MPLKNYDPTTYVHWYRKIDRHPDESMQRLAEAFCQRVAAGLGIQPSRIYWFEEADAGPARRAWSAYPAKRKSPAEDPLLDDCEFFRWPGQPETVFCGYIHHQAPLGIMINVRCRDVDLLKAVAEECFHAYQDVRGPDWRAKTGSAAVEAEARRFLDDNAGEIHAFFEEWVARHPVGR